MPAAPISNINTQDWLNWQGSETQLAVKQKQSTPLKWNLFGIALKAFWGLSCRYIDLLEKQHYSWNGAGESHTVLNACSCRLLYKSCSASSVRSGLCVCCWCSECLAWAPVVLIPTSYTERCIFPHYISNRSFSFFPFTCPWLPSPCGPPVPLCLSQCVSPLFPSLLHPPFLSFPCLFLSLYRTPNVSSNGNPGYESLPLTDRQSPPPSVSSSVLVTPSQSGPFYHCCQCTRSL